MAEPAVDAYFKAPNPSPPRGLSALAIAVVGLLIAGVVSVAAMAGAASSSSTPQDAVNALLDAAGSGNVNGIVAGIDPAESAAMGPTLDAIVTKLKGLGVLDASADLNRISGVSATFSGVTMHTEDLSSVHAGLAAVTLTGGTLHLRVDPSQLPVGTLVKTFLGSTLTTYDHTVALGGADASKTPLVMIERGGAWYLSVGYTIAEVARRHVGAPLPASGAARPPAVGSATPDGVVSDLLHAAHSDDVNGAIGLFDPKEAGALYDYASLFAGQVHIPTFTASGLSTTVSDVAGGKLVDVNALTITAGTLKIVFANGCLTVGAMPPMCASHLPGIDLSNVGIVVVSDTASDGSTRWFISPFRTVFDDLQTVVASLNLQSLAGLAQLGGVLGGGHCVTPTQALPTSSRGRKSCAMTK